MKPGSNTKPDHLYHDVPGVSMPSQRQGSEKRAKTIASLLDIQGKVICDLGCSAGGISIWMALLGAQYVKGFDYDEKMVDIGHQAAKANNVISKVKIRYADINPEFISQLSRKDIFLWLSHWMWFVKQHGSKAGMDALYTISTKGQALVFETAVKDGRAPLPPDMGVASQEDLAELLKKYTCYKKIIAGPKDDAWNNRLLYICTEPLWEWRRHKKTVVRRFTFDTVTKINEGKEVDPSFAWEVNILQKLQSYPYAPKLIRYDTNSITLSYEGERITSLSDKDYDGIIHMLKSEGIQHRDISPHNLVWNGHNAVLVDYAWANDGSDTRPVPENLGEDFKAPHGFDDEWSLRKVQKHLRNE